MIIFRVEHNRHRLRRMHVHICESRFERGRGLLMRPRPDQETAYLLPRCRSIHTIGMYYRIDVIFCDEEGRITSIRENLAPCRFAHDRRATHVWELDAGTARRWGWNIGDRLLPC